MKNFPLIFAAVLLSIVSTQAQNAHCGFDAQFEKMLEQDPAGLQRILEFQDQATDIARQNAEYEGERGGPRIIPTVFHVIHQGGNENISYEQIEDQMRILNEDYSRLNADAVNTRPEFQGVAANPNVEFRLAKLDPQGNCTDGVVRVWSSLTYNASDDNGVKGVSYWPSTKYFNVWVVASIAGDGTSGGITLGYAQFPGFGSANTDGVVVRGDFIGSIGTAANNTNVGRTLTHEAGHWLGLFHTFQGGCAGGFFDDGCDDTPPTAEANYGCPLTRNSCTNDSPDIIDQVENYMDYSNGTCQNMFSLDQKARMDGVLSGTRAQLISSNNLNSTGVLLSETPCAPKADFFALQRLTCTDEPIVLSDASFNGTVDTYSWSMPGGTPSTSSSANPSVSFASPGVYSITLTVSNAEGTDSHTQTDYVTVIPGSAQITSYFSFEGFEEDQEDYLVFSDGVGSTWQETNTAFTDNKSIYLNNYSTNPSGSTDEFQLPSVDMTQMNDPDLYFRLAYKQRSGGESDNLRVYVSKDCGQNWALRYNKSGASLSTVSGTQSSAYTPSSSADWELVNVNLGSYANEENLLVKFRGVSEKGNNIYIDDIQISGPLGVNDQQADFEFTVSPNPLVDNAQINLEVANSGNYGITLMDVAGKIVATIHQGTLLSGAHRFTLDRSMVQSAGIYLLQIQGTAGRTVKKLVVE
ncbi:MAG: T9SS type A sorting domain-containing protein [Flavobacteriales bacterium]|nr:T9SS type A sorting domain-containing protein [Flavobacteriales bacterium]